MPRSLVRPACPDEDRVGHVAERLVHRDDDRADDAGGKSHIVEAEPHMRPGEVGGRRRKDEAHGKPGHKRKRNARHRREVGGKQDLGKNRRKVAAEERRIEMRTKGLAAEPRVERNARDGRPDIEKVLAEQPEAEHQKESRDGRARHLRAGAPIDEGPGKRKEPCTCTPRRFRRPRNSR